MFGGLFKKETLSSVSCKDNELVSIVDGEQIDIKSVSDEVFAQEMLGKSIAFKTSGDNATIYAPCDGTLSVVYPTGHCFGITKKDGVEILVHIGVDTVEANGDGFKVLHKQDDVVKAGDPIVKVDIAKLAKTYDMSIMFIITNANNKEVEFKDNSTVKRGDVIACII